MTFKPYGRFSLYRDHTPIKGPEPINVEAIIEKLALESLLPTADSG